MKTTCPICHKEFELKQSEYNRGRRCCCKSCAAKYREINKRNMNKKINSKKEIEELANFDNDESRWQKLKNDEFVQLYRSELHNLESILKSKILDIEYNLEEKYEKITRPKIIRNVNDYGNADINGLIRKLSNRVKELEKENKYLKSQLDSERTAKDWDNAVFNGGI